MSRYMNINVCGHLLLLAFMCTLKMPGFNCDLDTALFKTIPKRQNLAYSPYMMYANLDIAAAGARGETHQEIIEVIKAHNRTLRSKIDGAIYLNKKQDLMPCFRKGLKMPIEPIDYSNKASAAKKINTFVKTRTEGRIEANIVLPEKLRAKTLMNVLTAHSINAEWEMPFKNHSKNAFPKNMMHVNDKFLYAKLKDLNSIAVEIPFKGNDTRMLILMPNDKNLDRLGKKLLGQELSKITKRLKLTKLSLLFPKVNGAQMKKSVRKEFYQFGMSEAMREWADFGKLHACGNDSYIAQFRHNGRFDANLESARFIGVSGIQWNLADDDYIESIEDIDSDIEAEERNESNEDFELLNDEDKIKETHEDPKLDKEDEEQETNEGSGLDEGVHEDGDQETNESVENVQLSDDIEAEDQEYEDQKTNNLNEGLQLAQRSRKTKEVAFVRKFFYAVLRENTVLFAGTITK